MTSHWPYDAREDDPLAALRIPVVGTLCPRYAYLVALCVDEDPDTPLWYGERPTAVETAQLKAFVGWRRHQYSATWIAAHFDPQPFDIDSGASCCTLIKRGENDWAYVVDSWRMAVPVPETWEGKEQPLDLHGLLDRIIGWGDRPNPEWERWKAGHPGAFELPAAGRR
ncbi:hypothetical protein ACIA49_38765 [Kribbella sp. NPDC051587]|uniref:hypothetical protein n=1 Tax=Kribbella sp. NPDC051587 TaxID=3364119 RepID=UPI0037B0DE81